MRYSVRIAGEDYATLLWLAERGYDARFCDLADSVEEVEGGSVWHFSEPSAWEFREAIEEDTDAFLACCGSAGLSRALLDLEGRIV